MAGLSRQRVIAVGVVLCVLGLVASGCASGRGGEAAKWPVRPINMIIAFAPGGTNDVTVQALRPSVEKALGQSLVLVHKPGSGGDVGWTELKNAAPDGYTLGLIATPAISINPRLRKTAYTVNDFTPICSVITDPGLLLVNPKAPYQSLEEFLRAAREKPGELTFGVPGTTEDWLGIMQLQEAAGVQFKIVPFDGDGPGLSALMGGHIDAYPCNLSACYSHVKAAKLRALAAFAKERISYLPEVPTTVELGINVTYASIRGFAGPKGLDKRVVDRFAAAVKEAVESPEFKKTAEDMAFWVEYLPPEEFARLLKDQDAVADRVITAYAGK